MNSLNKTVSAIKIFNILAKKAFKAASHVTKVVKELSGDSCTSGWTFVLGVFTGLFVAAFIVFIIAGLLFGFRYNRRRRQRALQSEQTENIRLQRERFVTVYSSQMLDSQ